MTVETIARLRISLNDTDPEVRRLVDAPVSANLNMLHSIVQAATGWKDYHLWEFKAGERCSRLPNPEWPDDDLAAAKNVKLGALIERGVRELFYTYDMGDSWHHHITVEAVGLGEPDAKYSRFFNGARRCLPEDVGGTPGYQNFLDAMADPNHEEHAEVVEWHGGRFDPGTLDELITKRRVAAITIRRAASKAAYAKRRA